MSQINVHKADMPAGAVINPFMFEVEEALDAIRTRAFELFEHRCGAPGDPLGDWLQAERDLFQVPPAEITETPDEITITVTFSACKDLYTDVLVTAHTIVVLMESWRDALRGKGPKECACGGGESKPVYRRFDFAVPIDVDTVKADLNGGILTIHASRKNPIVLRELAPIAAAASQPLQVCPVAA